MRWPRHSLWVLVMGLIWTISCGGGSAKKAAEESLAETRQIVAQFEAQIPAEDTKALELLETASQKIVLANRRIIEGEAEQASEILNKIKREITKYRGGTRANKRKNNLEVHGMVRYTDRKGGFGRFTKNENLAEVQKLQVGGRSGLILHLFKSSEIILPAQTDFEIESFHPDEKRLYCKLDRGELYLKKKTDKDHIEVVMNDYYFVFDEPGAADFRYMPLVNSVYVAVLDGKLSWRGEGGSGTLLKYDGFLWDPNNNFKIIQVPTVPEIDQPGHESKIGINASTGEADVSFRWHSNTFVANYQLQISDTPQFITRIYDNFKLERGQAEVSLGKGTYFWRVRSISANGVPGAFSDTMELYLGLYRDSNNVATKPREQADIPGPKISKLDYNLIGMTVIVSGKTDPDIKVNVNGVAAVQDDDGGFQAIVNFDRGGEHTLRIIALDPRTGGETFREKKIKIAY